METGQWGDCSQSRHSSIHTSLSNGHGAALNTLVGYPRLHLWQLIHYVCCLFYTPGIQVHVSANALTALTSPLNGGRKASKPIGRHGACLIQPANHNKKLSVWDVPHWAGSSGRSVRWRAERWECVWKEGLRNRTNRISLAWFFTLPFQSSSKMRRSSLQTTFPLSWKHSN